MSEEDLVCIQATIVNQKGLHARAAAKFVKLVGQFDAKVTVSRNGEEVLGTSIMGLMMLAAALGSEITIRACGKQRDQALEAVLDLIGRKFDEE